MTPDDDRRAAADSDETARRESGRPGGPRPGHEIVHEELKQAGVRLVTYVPDNVLSPLIRRLDEDDHFTTFCTAREEEAVGIVTGAWMGGMLGVVLMQTSGFATLPNVLAPFRTAYAVSPDGQRFLLNALRPNPQVSAITVVLNAVPR